MILFDRREALTSFLAAFTTVALVREARGAVPPGEDAVARWIGAQQEIAEAIAGGRIGGRAWAAEVERLASEVDVAALMAVVNRSELRAAGTPSGNDPPKRFVRFLDADGQRRGLAYGAALFDFAPHHVITPHGHRHMVSAHMVVAGKFRVRNFDRVGDEPGAMHLRPTRDYVAELGRVSTMCSERDNVHWFVPHGGPATTFDVIISGLGAGAPDYEIQAVDPLGGERRPDGILVAPIISFEAASAHYTADL